MHHPQSRRTHLLSLLLLPAALVLAAENDSTDVTYEYTGSLREALLASHPEWRDVEPETSEWRAPPTREAASGNARFGYDPAFDELQDRVHSPGSPASARLNEPEPSTLFRVKF